MSMRKRLLLGFVAGILAHLIFQGAFGSILHAAGVLPSLPFGLAPVPPLGVPRTVSLSFWAGLWGLAYILIEPSLTARLGRLPGGLAFGLAPLAVHWFVVQPLKGAGIGGGFQLARIPIEIGFHAAFGFGLAVIVGLATAGFGRRRAP